MCRFAGLIAASVAIVAFSTTVFAGDHSYCVVTVEDYPSDGATDVPLNPILMYSDLAPADPWESAIELRLEREDGMVVELTEPSISECHFIWRPTENLLPETTYEVRARDSVGELLATFTTGTERDDTPPEVTVVDDGTASGQFVFEADEEVVLVTADCPLDLGRRRVLTSPSDGVIELPCDGVELHLFDAAGMETNVTIPDVSGSCECTTAGARPQRELPVFVFAIVVAALALKRRR